MPGVVLQNISTWFLFGFFETEALSLVLNSPSKLDCLASKDQESA